MEFSSPMCKPTVSFLTPIFASVLANLSFEILHSFNMFIRFHIYQNEDNLVRRYKENISHIKSKYKL